MKQLLLAVDLGTSACKTALFHPDGRLAAAHTVEYPVLRPRPGWAEQDPDTWWEAACAGIRHMLEEEGVEPGSVAGVGIDGQSWACVPVDGEGKVLAPSPLWMDARAQDICRRMAAELGEEALFSLSGNPFQPSYTTPKILWFRENHPQVYHRAAAFLQSNSFLAYRLTGRISQDFSQGYGLHVFDVEKLCYSGEMCRALGIHREKLPELFPCHSVVGGVTREAAALTGLLEGTPVVAGGLDAACGALGAGVQSPGQTQEQGGQAGGMSICMDRPVKHRDLILSPHVVPGRWLLQGGTVGGGAAFRWLAEELGGPERLAAQREGGSQYVLLDRLAAAVPPGSDGVVFLPYLAGERSPLWDPCAKGVYYGMSFSTTRGHLFRALLEGTAYALRHNLEVAEEAGAPVGEMRAMGGAANSRLWTQIKADITGKTIRVAASDSATVLGAAILAGVGTGVFHSFQQAAGLASLSREHVPDPANHSAYGSGYRTYRELYGRLQPLMHREQSESSLPGKERT